MTAATRESAERAKEVFAQKVHAAKEPAEHGCPVLELEGSFGTLKKSRLALEY